MGESLSFWLLSGMIACFSVMVVTLKNPVAAAIALVCDLFLFAGIYVLMNAEFVAAIQVLVYAGAIVVLFTFVIMMLNLDADSLKTHLRLGAMEKIALFALFMVGFLAFVISLFGDREMTNPIPLPATAANDPILALWVRLFQGYLWPFELASILILLAVGCSVAIAKRKS